VALGFGLSVIDYGVNSQSDVREGFKALGLIMTGLLGVPLTGGGIYLWASGQHTLSQLDEAAQHAGSLLPGSIPARKMAFGWTFSF
jgi:hypothetical protein